MNTKICCICIKEAELENLKILKCKDENELQLLVKLQYVAPEKEWPETFLICAKCNMQLDSAYEFKQLCLANDTIHNDLKYHVDSFLSKNLDEECLSENDSVSLNDTKAFTDTTSDISTNRIALETFKCYHCKGIFQIKENLENHISLKHKNTCNDCEATFITKKELKKHKLEAHKNIILKFGCEICPRRFHLLKDILEHCISVHNMNQKDIKPYCCNECNSKFASSTLLGQHKKYHKGDRSFVCTTCGKAFITRRDLKGHEKLHENNKSYNCSNCDKSFKTSQNLRTHIYVVHTNPNQWKYSCTVCSKKFAMKTSYTEHIKRHEGNKEFACGICKKTFVSNPEMKKHAKLHSNIAPFKCRQCPKFYRDKRTLNMHLLKVHNEEAAKLIEGLKKFCCDICHSQFFNRSKLQRHLRTHTGLKPFKCPDCSKYFNDKSYLKSHWKNVHQTEGSMNAEEMYNPV